LNAAITYTHRVTETLPLSLTAVTQNHGDG